MKVLFGLALRQATGFVGSLQRFSGLDWSMPDHPRLWRRQKHLLVGSGGIKFSGEGGRIRKHRASRGRQWRKTHLGIAARGAAAIIPPRRNARSWKGHHPRLLARSEALGAASASGEETGRRLAAITGAAERLCRKVSRSPLL